jgi:hypothetical protein
VALTINERAAVAVFAVRLQTKQIMPHCDKINLCCNIVERARAGATPKEIYQTLPDVKPQIVYKVISRARRAGLLPAFKPILIGKARSLVTQLKLGSMYMLAQACGDDLLYWIVRNKPEGSTAAEFMSAILRDAMFDDEDEANAKT